jgi:hypothetical protein
MIMKWKDKKNVCLRSTTHDGKMVPVRVRRKDMGKSEVVTDCNSWMGGVDPSDAYLTNCCSTRKILEVLSKELPSFD